MALKKYNPTTSSQRGLILVDKSSLWKGKPVKALVEGKRKTGGRNNKGHVTSRGIAGGHKQKYRYHRLQASQVGHAGHRRAARI
jgi:large subunit ribosomal protein L2